MRELFVGDVDIFRGSDAVDNQFRFNIIGSALLLTAPQRYPVDVYRSRVDALRSQRANHTLKAHIHLMLDKRLRYGEIVKLDDGGQNLFSQEVLVPPVAVGFEALTELGLQLVKRAGIADIFGEFVVQLGEFFSLQAENLDGVVIGLARKFGVRVVRGVNDIKILMLADAGAAQIFVEGLHGFFGADVAEDAVCTQGLATAFLRAHELQLHEVAVLDRASLDGREGSGAFGHFLQRFVDVFVGDVHHGHFEIEILVIAKLELGESFEDGAEFERLAFGKIELVNLGLRNGGQFLLGDGLFDALRNERLHDFTLDIVGEAAADQRDGRFAGAKPGNAGDARKFLGDALHRFGDFVGGNLEVEFAAAGSFGHATILSFGTVGSEVENSLVVSMETAREKARQVRITLYDFQV